MGRGKKEAIIALLIFLALPLSAAIDSVKVDLNLETAQEKRILGKIRTIYTTQGRPTQNTPSAKGWHQISDSQKLTAGKARVTVNTSTANGRQDVSFLSKTSYRGTAFSLDTLNGKSYRLIPLSGTEFVIISSDSTDTSTVLFLVEGE